MCSSKFIYKEHAQLALLLEKGRDTDGSKSCILPLFKNSFYKVKIVNSYFFLVNVLRSLYNNYI